jgi:hypothetical protein
MFGWTLFETILGGDAVELFGGDDALPQDEDDELEEGEPVTNLTLAQHASPPGLRRKSTGV